MITMFWAVVIGVLILLIAIFIQQWVFTVVEEDNIFFGVVGGFLLLFIVSAVTMSWILPDLTAPSNLGGMIDAWVDPSIAFGNQSDLPLYGE